MVRPSPVLQSKKRAVDVGAGLAPARQPPNGSEGIMDPVAREIRNLFTGEIAYRSRLLFYLVNPAKSKTNYGIPNYFRQDKRDGQDFREMFLILKQ
jgi:hypothetical protein